MKDFSFITAAASQSPSQTDIVKQKPEVKAAPETPVKAQANPSVIHEAAAKAAKLKAYEDAKIKAQIEVAARARIETEARTKQNADATRIRAEQAAHKAHTEAEATKARIEAEVRARLEAEIRVKQEAEARIKREAEAIRIKAEKEAEKLRLDLEAAKAKAEMELRIRLEAEARARVEFEARLKREAEAERMKLEKEQAENEAARVKAEAELRMRQEAEIRIRAELDARAKSATLAKQAEENKLNKDLTANVGKNAGEKLRQSFVESFDNNNKGVATGSFKLEQFSLVNTGKIAAVAAETTKNETVAPGGGSKVKAAIEARKRKEAEASQKIADLEAARLQSQRDEAARVKAGQNDSASRIRAEQESVRLKAEHEAYRLRIQQEQEQAKADEEAQKLAEQQSKQWEEAQQRAAFLAKAEQERQQKETAAAKAKMKLKPARVPRKPVPVGKIFFGLITLALLAVAGLPYILPLDSYIPPMEAEISSLIKQPVHIKKIGFALLPLPKLELYAVTVGNSNEINAATVTVNFDLSALFAATKSINELRFNNVAMTGVSLQNSVAWLQGLGSVEKYPVAHMQFNNLQINAAEIKLPVLNGQADFNAQGKFTHASLTSTDAKFALELQQVLNVLKIDASLHNSALPLFDNVKFNDLTVTATVANGEAQLSDFFAHIYGGTVTGKGQLDWSNGWVLNAQLNARNMDLQQMFPDFGISGELLGELKMTMAGPTLTQLDKVDKDFLVEGSFEGKNGVISKLDFETVARMGARPGVAGHTNFSELEGTVKINKNGQHIFVSKLATGSAKSRGLIDIDAKEQMSGKFQMEISGMNGTIPLRLSGTTKEPTLESGH
ncbi:MAG: AsmA family protein [Gallionellaceae bacterium]